MKAIQTKLLGPTPNRPYRIKAFDCDGNSVTIGAYTPGMPDTGIAQMETHKYVAEELKIQMGWKGQLVGGATENGFAFCFVK